MNSIRIVKLIPLLIVLFCLGCSWKAWRTAGTVASWTYVTKTIIDETPKIASFFSKDDKWAKLGIGDNMFKVMKIVGKPTETRQKGSEEEEWIYHYSKKERRIVTFKNGFLKSISVERI